MNTEHNIIEVTDCTGTWKYQLDPYDRIMDGDVYYWKERHMINGCSNPSLMNGDDVKVVATNNPNCGLDYL